MSSKKNKLIIENIDSIAHTIANRFYLNVIYDKRHCTTFRLSETGSCVAFYHGESYDIDKYPYEIVTSSLIGYGIIIHKALNDCEVKDMYDRLRKFINDDYAYTLALAKSCHYPEQIQHIEGDDITYDSIIYDILSNYCSYPNVVEFAINHSNNITNIIQDLKNCESQYGLSQYNKLNDVYPLLCEIYKEHIDKIENVIKRTLLDSINRSE